MSDTPKTPPIVVGAYVTRECAQRFREIAASEHRSVSAELRRMIERRIAEADAEQSTAALSDDADRDLSAAWVG